MGRSAGDEGVACGAPSGAGGASHSSAAKLVEKLRSYTGRKAEAGARKRPDSHSGSNEGRENPLEVGAGASRCGDDDNLRDLGSPATVANKGRACAFTWHKQFMDLMSLDTKEHLEAHLVPIRHRIRAGELEAKDYNNLTVRLENGGGKVHCFVIQPTSDDALESLGWDLASLSFGILVEGVAYWFYSKRNRDNMFAWLNKGLTE